VLINSRKHKHRKWLVEIGAVGGVSPAKRIWEITRQIRLGLLKTYPVG
jgi:hypothetical protein